MTGNEVSLRFLLKVVFCCAMRDLKHKILLILIAVTIIGEVASILLWITNRPLPNESSPRFTLAVDYLIAVVNAAVFAALNLVAFIWIARRNKIGAPILITISIINRAISYPLFIGGAHAVFITWTVILVTFAYTEYRSLSNFETAFLSGGILLDLAVSALLFNAGNSGFLGIVFYLVVLAVLVGIVIAIKKLRQ
jgi:hypothetical protein